MLRSLNISKIDFFSLDVEGVESEILLHFPFDEIQVDVWIIEHFFKDHEKVLSRDENADMIQDVDFTLFMESKGYYLFDLLCITLPDYVFVRRNSDIFRRLKVPKKFWKRRNICNRKGFIGWDDPVQLPDLRDRIHYPNITFQIIED